MLQKQNIFRSRNVVSWFGYLVLHDIMFQQHSYNYKISPMLHKCKLIFKVMTQNAKGKYNILCCIHHSRLWVSAEQPRVILSCVLVQEHSSFHDVMNSMLLTTEGNIEGSQQSVLSTASHGCRKTQFGHQVPKCWLGASHQFHHLFSLKDKENPTTIKMHFTENHLTPDTYQYTVYINVIKQICFNNRKVCESNLSLAWALDR